MHARSWSLGDDIKSWHIFSHLCCILNALFSFIRLFLPKDVYYVFSVLLTARCCSLSSIVASTLPPIYSQFFWRFPYCCVFWRNPCRFDSSLLLFKNRIYSNAIVLMMCCSNDVAALRRCYLAAVFGKVYLLPVNSSSGPTVIEVKH